MYVLDRERQLSLIREMTQLRRDKQKWEVYYHHPTTNVMWKSFFPKATLSERGPKVLRTEPVPDRLEERLETCLIESSPENAAGLAIELSIKPEKWTEVINIFDENYRNFNRKQLSIFLKELGVENHQSHFNQINFEVGRSDFSEEFFDKLARRSKIIRFKRMWFP